jgi:acetolactate synthase-1/2/3 large subunit
MLGMHAARFTNMALEECDLLIAAGVRFDDRATGKVDQFCPRARIVHIDLDASELGKIRTPMLSIHADVGDVLRAVLPRLPAIQRPAWLDRLSALRSQFPLLIPEQDNPCSPYGLILHTAQAVDDEAIVTTDVGQHQMWVAQAYPVNRPRQLLTSAGLGTMGFGLPAAIGAALARPGRMVLCFTGDGSLLINVQELATAVEQQVCVKLLVMNNRHLGLVRQQQELFYGGRFSACAFAVTPDFVALARAFGMRAWDLTAAPDPAETLHRALQAPGPGLLHVAIPGAEKVYPMVPPGGANRTMIGGEKYVYASH